MKQYWQRAVLKINALSLRERGMVFAGAALLLMALANEVLIDPQFVKQKQLSLQIKQDQAKIAEIQTEIQQKVKLQTMDPDAANRARLQSLKQQFAQTHGTLLDMQKGLVTPDKMAEMLESILKRNGRLRLVSLKTLPVAGVNEPVQTDAKASAEKAAGVAASAIRSKSDTPPAVASIYKHEVEITVQGGYFDMMNYMAELEMMPWQLFWGKAKLKVEEYPRTTLTLTLFTLSLDKKWLNI